MCKTLKIYIYIPASLGEGTTKVTNTTNKNSITCFIFYVKFLSDKKTKNLRVFILLVYVSI